MLNIGLSRKSCDIWTTIDKCDAILSRVYSLQVVVFSKTWCPFCERLKKLLNDKSIAFYAVELDELEGGGEQQVQDLLAEKSGQKTVPNVFINGRHLGKNFVTLYRDTCFDTPCTSPP